MSKAQNTIVASIFNTTLSLTFSDGNDLHLDYTTLAPEIVKQAVLHGLKQKLVDAAAIGAKDGKYATVAQKYAAVKEVYDRLTGANGQPASWNKVRGNGDTPSSARGLLVRALMELRNKDEATVDRYLDTLSKEQLSALRNNSQVAAKIAELKSRGAAIDSDELLAGLDSDDEPDLMAEPETVTADVGETPAKKPSRARGRSRATSQEANDE